MNGMRCECFFGPLVVDLVPFIRFFNSHLSKRLVERGGPSGGLGRRNSPGFEASHCPRLCLCTVILFSDVIVTSTPTTLFFAPLNFCLLKRCHVLCSCDHNFISFKYRSLQRPSRSLTPFLTFDGVRYSIYAAIIAIVTNHYRPRRDATELDARKVLTRSLAKLATASEF